MKNISTAFKKALYENERNYLAFADVTLSDGTVLHLTNSEIWTGGYTREDAISEDENFTVLGSAIAGSATLIINNIEDQFSEYSFKDAKVRLYEGMEFIENGVTRLEKLKGGRYTVDDTQYNGAKITLSLLDNMIQFDRPYSESTLQYPATCDTIVRNLCTVCGVTLRTFDSTYKNTVIQTRPSDEAITCREVLSWVATICGTFAKCNVDGELELKWFDITKLQSLFDGLDGGVFDDGTPRYTSGDTADGGTFNPWNTGYVYDAGEFSSRDDIAIISSLKSQNIAVDNTVIAGIRIYVKNPNEDAESDILTYTYPANYSEGVLIEISDNEFITPSNANTILQRLKPLLYGLTFRKANVSQLNDPSLEAGDVGYIIDRKNNHYPIIITRNTFKLDGFQTIVCGSQSVLKNSSVQFSDATKSFLEYKRLLNKERTAREVALEQLSEALAEHSGLYSTTQTTQSGNIYYLHDMPDLADSKVVWKMTTEAFGVTTNYNGAHPEQTVWNGGMTVNGDVIANILDAIGVNAGWINTGQLVIKNSGGQEIFFADVDAGVLRISAIGTAKQEAISAAATDATTKANNALNSAKSYTDTQLGNYDNEITAILSDMQDQIDGQIESWYYDYEPTLNNVPASGWSDETERTKHEGDIFYWKSKGYAYRFLKDGNTWTWKRIEDTDITTAIGLANDAQALADQKKRIFIVQPTPPYDEGDLWTQGSSGDVMRCKNGIHRVSGASYVASDWEKASKYTDDSSLNAFKNGDYATFVTNTNTALGTKITTYYQSTTPTNAISGDLWIDGGNGNILKRYNGSSWVAVQDEGIQSALTAAGDAQSTADSKIITFAQATQPTATDVGDLWIDTGDNNKMWRWNGGAWVVVTDNSGLKAFHDGTYATFVQTTNTKLNAKITTFYQTSSPTASATGDLWIDTDDNNKLYRWNGSSWQEVRDKGIQSALTAASTAQTTADSKIITFAQASQPTATDTGDLWIDTDDNNKLYRWNGSTWSPMTDTSGLQSWITGTYTQDMTDLQSQIDGKIETWRQATDPSLSWTDTATKDKHVKDLWYCTSTTDVIPSWLLPYVGKDSGMTTLLSQRADDYWFSITNDANFSIDGATSTNIYIDSNSAIAFANSQPSSSGRTQAYNLNICRRDGQAVSIKHQTITSGSNKAVKIKFSGYTAYSQTDQTSEYANEYEVFFTNSNEVYINVLKQPTNTSYLGDTSIKDNSATVTFSLSAGAHVSIKKVSGAWVATVNKYTNNTSWIYTKTGNVYSWEKLDSGIPSELLDEIDGKAQIFTTSSTPTDASEGDLWFKSATDPIKTYVNGQWVEYNKYTDDSTANANLVTAKSYSDTNLQTAKNYADSAVSTYNTNLDQQAVFNKLTNNGQTQGIFLENNRIYINMTYASTGTLVVGGSSSNTDGEIEVKNSSGTRIGRIDKTGIYFGNIISSLTNPYFRLYDNGVLESRFGSSSYYAKMGSTYGFEVQGNGINAKLYASSWTYKQNDTVDPGAEVPDYSESIDINTRPGFYGYNTAFKVTDSSYSSRGTYTAIGKNYIEIAYSSRDLDLDVPSSYPTMVQLRSTSSHQTLMLAYRYGGFGTEKSLVLDETGFRQIVNNGSTYKPYTGNFVVGSKTYFVRGGIICT